MDVRAGQRRSVQVDVVRSVSERTERGFVAPRLDHDHAVRDVLGFVPVGPCHHGRLRVPFVAADPQPMYPGRQRFPVAGLIQERGQNVGRRAVVERDFDAGLSPGFDLDPQPRRVGTTDVEPHPATGTDMESPTSVGTADNVRERHRKIRPASLRLVLVLLEHDRVQLVSALVHAIEAFPETGHVGARRQRQREPDPMYAPGVGERGDTAVNDPGASDRYDGHRRLPTRRRRLVPARRLVGVRIRNEAIAHDFAVPDGWCGWSARPCRVGAFGAPRTPGDLRSACSCRAVTMGPPCRRRTDRCGNPSAVPRPQADVRRRDSRRTAVDDPLQHHGRDVR